MKILKGGWEHGTRGGEFHFIYPSFKLPRNMDPSRPLVMHVSTPLTLQFRMTLYSMEGFWRAGFYLFLIIGFCSGILVTMLLSNMVLYAHMIEKQYFIYMLYVAATLFYQSSLFGLIHYVAPWSDRFIMPNITVPGSAMIICYLLFTVFFLETEHTAPRCNIVLRSLVACNFIFIAMMFLGFQWLANLLTYLGATVAVIAVFITALSSLRSGYLPARYFIIAAGVFLASSMIFLLKFYGVLPSNTLTMNIMFFGSSAESILLSLALRYRIKVMQEERQFLRERGRI